MKLVCVSIDEIYPPPFSFKNVYLLTNYETKTNKNFYKFDDIDFCFVL